MWLAVAGGLGTLARYGLTQFVQRLHEPGFPWGTLLVNLLGCFAFALIWALAERHFQESAELRLVVLVGFMGAFTTYSTFTFQTGELIAEKQYAAALANVAIHNLAGLLALFAGLAAGTKLADRFQA
ncbi:MAG: fluoride efflux transporter CrcB [Planctomycetota bacterium]|nr:MAG: fluoride efflux transporter CrcB [Planctomycetota bacterium]